VLARPPQIHPGIGPVGLSGRLGRVAAVVRIRVPSTVTCAWPAARAAMRRTGPAPLRSGRRCPRAASGRPSADGGR
jgi:hypothetical protein